MAPSLRNRIGEARQREGAYARLADLPLAIDGYATERSEMDVSSGFRRVTTTVVLHGGGLEGRGEDVTYVAEDHDPYPLDLPLAGERTLDAFSTLLGGLDLFPARPPQQEFFRFYRRWAFESAALDLALRQQGKTLGAALGRDYRPVRFVVSTWLDITPWLDVDPALEFKLDPTPEWDADTVARIAATGRVRVLDFKAFYEGSPVDNPPDPAQYRAVAARSRTPCSRIRSSPGRLVTLSTGKRRASASTRRSTPGPTSRRCRRVRATSTSAVPLRLGGRAARLR